MTQTLSQLEHSEAFIERHIGSSAEQQQQLLEAVGARSLSALIQQIVPADIQLPAPPPVGDAATEHQALAELKAIASQNQRYKSYIGMGYSAVLTPPVILRNMLENPGWYTAYTPYQPEVSQGRLEALLNFQTLTLDLTGLDLASASLLDEATAAAEAMALAKRASKLKDANRFFVADDVHPQTLDVVRTRAETFGFEVIVDKAEKVLELQGVFGVLLQQVGTTGELHNYSALLAELKNRKIGTSVAADIMALVLLTAPGKQGADVVFGSAQRFGVPMGYGGPHAAFFACRDEFKRSMPGRIIGVSRDAAGNTALRMAMQTREQHIRREKANSNICTSQVLLANIASLYAVYHGPQGLQRIAGRIHRLTDILAAGLQQAGLALRHKTWFDTLTVEVKDKAAVLERALSFGINLRTDIHGAVGITLDEATSREDVQTLFALLAGDDHGLDIDALDAAVSKNSQSIPAAMLRQDPILTHPVFNRYHSETEMMRYMHRLERKDLALNQAMIPLGSCTMKLNAAAEMIPITWPEFSELHPFCPPEQAAGYQQMIGQLSQWLVQLTGYDAVCMQPNSGAQGEYAGLLAIRRYHESRNEAGRHICLIPSSAHGTNPASAQMAGMSVVVVACDKNGNIDLHDLRVKAEQAGEELSCIMVTYPSTHGVYEETIREVCQIVHQFGGQVYLDGANMNAQVGITTPGYIGADVSHLNLHKTFCIPHGGGGPGMGPIGVKAHLAPFVPGHSVVQIDGVTTQQGAVSAAPFGSASILPISWMYIRMMGAEGLKQASQVAILNANYIATRLKDAYPVLYTGRDHRVAHECILDIRPLKEETGISEMDIAKRLIDYGFHAPTMSFPVAGTLMVEPTESESKVELDRFIDAMLAIRAEIDRVAKGEWPLEDNPLVNAPHVQAELVSDWQHAYSRELAVFPIAGVRENKYWPSVKRLDDVYGDRNLFCSCVPMSDYE
ncbi:MAG: aminomethyl-transferring glycine dehydrogenase [Serratia liquefaciens]|jgi:glycine dehydrogenase|uniref:aminomethyl-transferring glycine dehydrogenase n=1 Tax=Serratia liquefaciens TaxID=614 RepID=UPI0021789E97|nr:aminomethyl-transferring glycine dehydrogenase [Serratia liquefaciens]MCH4197110.1 aminomethyl-transferring glycine dehydrogenase [Serratia liquefaciens]MCH4264440.1 aminomethyl-transferring glycine dehydrogenase [Serratia liquefaciens]MCI1216983.1 aminomethyl-transferring glycine dehydrogenase [Serratia liquefaciens]MCI1237810.1 aminomethyl-transferring glycine dehydrogenase [Serratia liquefaciens]MCI1253364.1 aminomethyl-transferring glycine dehydrogenase [Serratia liquefaciens]